MLDSKLTTQSNYNHTKRGHYLGNDNILFTYYNIRLIDVYFKLNLLFMIFILKLLYRTLNTPNKNEINQYKRTFKATLILGTINSTYSIKRETISLYIYMHFKSTNVWPSLFPKSNRSLRFRDLLSSL